MPLEYNTGKLARKLGSANQAALESKAKFRFFLSEHIIYTAMRRNFNLAQVARLIRVINNEEPDVLLGIDKFLTDVSKYLGHAPIEVEKFISFVILNSRNKNDSDITYSLLCIGEQQFKKVWPDKEWWPSPDSFPADWGVNNTAQIDRYFYISVIEFALTVNDYPEYSVFTDAIHEWMEQGDSNNNALSTLLSAEFEDMVSTRKKARYICDGESAAKSINWQVFSPQKVERAIAFALEQISSKPIVVNIIRNYLSDEIVYQLSQLEQLAEFILDRADVGVSFLEKLLLQAMHPAFEAAKYPLEYRSDLVRQIAKQLIFPDVAQNFEIQPGRKNSSELPVGISTADFRNSEIVKLPPEALTFPTRDELEKSGRTFAKRRAAAREEGETLKIIDHLRDVWGPWIEAGMLSRPYLLHADPTAYNALSRWLGQDKNDLKTALGHDIPTRSEVAHAGLTPESIREAHRISGLLSAAKKRDAKSR